MYLNNIQYYSNLLDAMVYTKEKIIFFYGGILSQWADCNFYSSTTNEDVNCAEQAMMLNKAKTFNDNETYEQILISDNPRVQKSLGRRVKKFDKKVWDSISYKLVVQNNYDKFSQHAKYRELLLLTDPYELVEASPTDLIWGIGMGRDNPNILDKSKWGKNLLGKALMEVRERFIKIL
jgi:hypothetical protein